MPTLGQALSCSVSSPICGVRAHHILNLHARELAAGRPRHLDQVVELSLEPRCVLRAALCPPQAPPRPLLPMTGCTSPKTSSLPPRTHSAFVTLECSTASIKFHFSFQIWADLLFE